MVWEPWERSREGRRGLLCMMTFSTHGVTAVGWVTGIFFFLCKLYQETIQWFLFFLLLNILQWKWKGADIKQIHRSHIATALFGITLIHFLDLWILERFSPSPQMRSPPSSLARNADPSVGLWSVPGHVSPPGLECCSHSPPVPWSSSRTSFYQQLAAPVHEQTPQGRVQKNAIRQQFSPSTVLLVTPSWAHDVEIILCVRFVPSVTSKHCWNNAF